MKYNFLKPDSSKNEIRNISNMWTPHIVYDITLGLETKDSSLIIERQSEPFIMDGYNSLQPKGMYSITLLCGFRMFISFQKFMMETKMH